MQSPRRPNESGWVLAASLVLSTFVVAVTVTYARHAILSKQSLEFGKGASEVEEASRSELERVRELMRVGNKPGTEDEGSHDHAVTPNGEVVVGERQEVGHGKRELRSRAHGNGESEGDQARLKARSDVVPGSGSTGDRTTLDCDTGSPLMMAGNLQIISGDVTLQGVQLAGLFLLEEGAHLTLEDVVLRGTIVTRAGLCNSNAPTVGSNRPRVSVYGGLRLLAGTDLPDTAVVGPDLILDADESSRVEVRGFVAADEIRLKGRGTMRGMAVSGADEDWSAAVRRPGYGRGAQGWPQHVRAGAEEVSRLAFPSSEVDETTLTAMLSGSIE
ncbi:MAG: hypothetical protein ACYTG2_02170 [Planctomycetota bacterium]